MYGGTVQELAGMVYSSPTVYTFTLLNNGNKMLNPLGMEIYTWEVEARGRIRILLSWTGSSSTEGVGEDLESQRD